MDLDRESLTAEITTNTKDKLLIVDYWAPWCQPCLKLSPILEEVVKRYPGVVLGKINIEDRNKALAAENNVRSIPTMHFYKDGQLVGVLVGLVSEVVIEDKIKQFIEDKK